MDIFNKLKNLGKKKEPYLEDNIVEIEIPLFLDEIIYGCEKKIEFFKQIDCDLCLGKGYNENDVEECKKCFGKGIIIEKKSKKISHTCDRCGGKGVIITKYCEKCSSRGKVLEKNHQLVTIPKGVNNNTLILLSKKDKNNNSIFGKINYQLPPEIEIYDKDIIYNYNLIYFDYLMNNHLEIPFLDEILKIPISKSTIPKKTYTLHEKGIPYFGEEKRGDLIIKINIIFPKNPRKEELYLLSHIKKIYQSMLPDNSSINLTDLNKTLSNDEKTKDSQDNIINVKFKKKRK